MQLGQGTSVARPIDPTAPRWMRYVPLLTGLLAAVAGFLAVRGANLANDAIYRSNQGVLFQAQASDTWAEYQADSVKARVVETALLGGVADPGARDQLTAQGKDLRARQPALRTQAMDLERRRDAQLASGDARLAEKDILAYASVAVQLGIGLASVAALARRREAFLAGGVVGAAGVAIAAYTLLSAL